MGRFLGMVGASVGGWLGWRLAAGWGMVPAYFTSLIGAAAGLYAARRLLLELLD